MHISVVVPLYNHADVLPLCLHALLAQRPLPDEIIVVDDGSIDDGAAVAGKFARSHPVIRMIRHRKNRGCPAALNTGLAEAKGDLILFAGADDAVLPGLLAAASDQFEKHPEAGLCCGEIALIDHKNDVTGFRPPILPCHRSGFTSPGKVRDLIRRSDNWLCGPSIVYHRQRLQAIGGFDETLGSLCDGLAARLLAFRHGFLFVPQVLAAWRISATSLSHATALAPEHEARNREAAGAWFARQATDIPGWYPALFERRLRFGTARLQALDAASSGRAATRAVARLFFSYRPMAPDLYVIGSVRRVSLARRRRQEVRKALGSLSVEIPVNN